MESWYSFIYLYGVGGLLFGVAVALGLKKKVLDLERRADRRILFGLVAVYLFYAGGQAIWNYLAATSAG